MPGSIPRIPHGLLRVRPTLRFRLLKLIVYAARAARQSWVIKGKGQAFAQPRCCANERPVLAACPRTEAEQIGASSFRGYTRAFGKPRGAPSMPMFCRSCGASLADRSAFCSACGTPVENVGVPFVQSPSRTPIRASTPARGSQSYNSVGDPINPTQDEERSRIHLGPLFRAFVIFGLLILLGIWFYSSDEGHTPASSIRNDATVNETPKPAVSISPHIYAIGEEVSVGYWSYRCNSAEWPGMIDSGFGSLETPDAAFLVLNLSVTNNDRTASTLPPPHLIDLQGREYDESDKGVLMPGRFDVLKKLNPSVSSRGYVVFDAPRVAYLLKVSGGFESKEYALIALPIPPQRGNESVRPEGSQQ